MKYTIHSKTELRLGGYVERQFTIYTNDNDLDALQTAQSRYYATLHDWTRDKPQAEFKIVKKTPETV